MNSLNVIQRSRKTSLNMIKTKKYLDSDFSVSSSYLVYSRLKPSLVSVLISVLISVSISVPISFRGQTRYGLGLISKKPSSFKKKPSFIQEKTEFFSSENRGQNKRPLGFLRWQLTAVLLEYKEPVFYFDDLMSERRISFPFL